MACRRSHQPQHRLACLSPSRSRCQYHQALFSPQPSPQLRDSLAGSWCRPPYHPVSTRSLHPRTHSRLPASVTQTFAHSAQPTASIADLQSRPGATVTEVTETLNRPHLEIADIIRAQGERFVARNRSWIRWAHQRAVQRLDHARQGDYLVKDDVSISKTSCRWSPRFNGDFID